MAPAVTELLYPHSAHSWTRRLAMYPRLRPPQRGQTKPLGHRCAVRCSPHRTSSPKHERNSLTVMMGFLFHRLGFFISDMISPFVRLIKLDIHLNRINWPKCQVVVPGLLRVASIAMPAAAGRGQPPSPALSFPSTRADCLCPFGPHDVTRTGNPAVSSSLSCCDQGSDLG